MNYDEPRYVDDDDIWDERGWQYPDSDLQRALLEATKRTKFHTEAEYKRTKAIEENVDKYPRDFVEAKLEWARGMNVHVHKITLPTLIKVIRNPDNLASYRKDHPVEIRHGYDEELSW